MEDDSVIYLDYNATTPLADEVISGITKSLKNDWGNPSSNYKHGIDAKRSLEESRIQVGKMLNANPEDIIFTSGGTEANNMVISSVVQDYLKNPNYRKQYGIPHIITSSVEHDSVMNAIAGQNSLCQESQDDIPFEYTVIPVNPTTGSILSDSVMEAIRPNTCLITIMHANNETGVIMPIQEIAKRTRALNSDRRNQNKNGPHIFIHTDAAQTIGKIRVDVDELDVDYLTVVGHKFYGPRIGALFVKGLLAGLCPIHPLIHGGGQERGYRSGTENTPMIVGLGIAADLVATNLEKYEAHMRFCQNYFERKLLDLVPGVKVNFISNNARLPNTISTAVPELFTGQQVLEECAGQIEASLGAACHSHSAGKPSKILLVSGLTEDEARRTIRFSLGRSTSTKDIDRALDLIAGKIRIKKD